MKYLYIFTLLLFISCEDNPYSQAPILGEEFEIEFNEQLIFDGTDISIEFVDIKDFRCNISTINCAWSGDATVTLKINSEEQEFNYYNPERNYEWQEDTVSTIKEYKVTLNTITPEHRETENEPKKNYKVVLKVSPK